MASRTSTAKGRKVVRSVAIRSLAAFENDTARFLTDLAQPGHAVLLTIDDEPELAVASAATFQRMLEAVDVLDTLRCIREGLDQGRRGEGIPSELFFAAFRRKHRLAKPRA